MNWLKKVKFFAALMFVCGMLLSVSVSSCDSSKATEDNTTEEAEGESEHPAEDAEHPAGDSSEQPAGEHPKSDTTQVEESAQ